MYRADFSLNTVTLLALSLVVGILIDDEIENIARHLRMGKPPKEAALEAADEIGLAVDAHPVLYISRMITSPLVRFADAAKRLRLDGNKGEQFSAEGTKELRTLATALNNMRHRIRKWSMIARGC